ncbi:MAG: UbiA family prenyltransferase [Agriterribacter sp.]
MRTKITAFIFFANYFIGLLAVALAVETIFQLELPFNTLYFYLFLFSATVLYYTRAYMSPPGNYVVNNPRTEWYNKHNNFIRKSQWVLLLVCIVTGALEFTPAVKGLDNIPFFYWVMILSVPIAAFLYYGLLPQSLFSLNLRNTGWLKPFIIGYVWAGCVSLFPVVMHVMKDDMHVQNPVLMLWLFIKNWMFCAVNAIMFDLKDYADDANKELKTFVVRFGLRKTIYLILIPLLLIGFLSFIFFSLYNHFEIIIIALNLIPFISLLVVAFSLHRRKKILYYLIVIDGLLLVKAMCGITGMLVLKYF